MSKGDGVAVTFAALRRFKELPTFDKTNWETIYNEEQQKRNAAKAKPEEEKNVHTSEGV